MRVEDMGELARIAHEAGALTSRLIQVERALGSTLDGPKLVRSTWLSKKGTDGDLFLSAASHGLHARSQRLSLARTGTQLWKYSPDQARDEHGRWTDEGGGSGASTSRGLGASVSANTAIDAIRSTADNLIRTRTQAAANRFLSVTRDALSNVADGLYDDDATFWQRVLSVVAAVFQTLAAASDAIGLGVAAGVGVGTAIGASAGIATAVALAGWLTYEKWAEKKDLKRSKREINRTKNRIAVLEDEVERLRARRRRK